VYVASGPGRKIDAMRADPHVCFEVDGAHGTAGWRSVIADGVYAELTAGRERRAGLALLDNISVRCSESGPATHDGMIVFRMDLTEKTGRIGCE
jgi:nitroimidazol reductase NimA-like FMN-containing flavoprotein (pyridoxamine 5'-phosphate oxidase superfamily)